MHERDFVITHETVSFALTRGAFTAQAANSLEGKGNAYIIQQEKGNADITRSAFCISSERPPVRSPRTKDNFTFELRRDNSCRTITSTEMQP